MPLPHFDLIAEVIAALMWGPKSQKEMTEITGYNCQGVNHMLRALEASGVVYRHSTRPSTRGSQLSSMRCDCCRTTIQQSQLPHPENASTWRGR